MYRTIKDQIKLKGIGLHTGTFSELVLEPAGKFSKINFFVNTTKIPVDIKNVISTQNCIVLGSEREKVYTVEHLLSALYGLGITDLNIYLTGNEIPAFDGSAKIFVESILNTGLIEEDKPLYDIWTFTKEEIFNINSSKYEIYPSLDKLELECEINLEIVGSQKKNIVLTQETYVEEISSAKTFCYLKDVEKIKSSGLGKGGSLENVIVIGDNGAINSVKMSFRDEFVRHKLLDFIGDFSLCMKQVRGKIKIFSPNHSSNIKFISILENKNLFSQIYHI